MNYKLLFPTYRTRQRFVVSTLDQITTGVPVARMLNLGSGEGDIDRTLKHYARDLDACDINEADIAHATALNDGIEGIHYSVQNGESLTYPDSHFDIVTCLEVIEHVQTPQRLLAEITRVLRPGGHAILTCPNEKFPVTYDPINYALKYVGSQVSFGAYGYGHSWLVNEAVLADWLAEAGLRVRDHQHLSKNLAGLLECYWPGALQKLLKANAGNRNDSGQIKSGSVKGIRPSVGEPPLLSVADAIIDVDARLFANGQRSVGLGYLLQRAP